MDALASHFVLSRSSCNVRKVGGLWICLLALLVGGSLLIGVRPGQAQGDYNPPGMPAPMPSYQPYVGPGNVLPSPNYQPAVAPERMGYRYYNPSNVAPSYETDRNLPQLPHPLAGAPYSQFRGISPNDSGTSGGTDTTSVGASLYSIIGDMVNHVIYYVQQELPGIFTFFAFCMGIGLIIAIGKMIIQKL
jgi:hypothetical protein